MRFRGVEMSGYGRMVTRSHSEGTPANKTPKDLLTRAKKAGYDRAFVTAALLPDWWSPQCEKDPALVQDLEIRLARFLRVSMHDVRDPTAALTPPSYDNARLRRVAREGAARPTASIHAALSIARAVLRSLREPLPSLEKLPTEPREWHAQLVASGGARLETALDDLWRRGIPVIQVSTLPSPRFQGLACILEGRPVVVLAHEIDVPARLFSHLAHEAGHIAAGDCEEDAPVIDEDDEVNDSSKMERAADRYAAIVTLGTEPPPPPSANVMADFQRLARAAVERASDHGLDAASLAWYWASREREFAKGTLALKAIYKHLGGARVIRSRFDQHVDVDAASDSDRALLRCVKGEPDTHAAAR